MTKFKALSKEEKLEHIWEYYNIHIIGGIIAIILLGNLLWAVFSPKAPKPAVNVVIVGLYDHDDQRVNAFEKEIKNVIGDQEDQRVDVTFFPVNWAEASPMTMATDQKMVLMFQSMEIDVLCLEKEKFKSYMDNSDNTVFEPLQGISGLEMILDQNQENLVKEQLEGQEKIYGMFTKNNIKLKQLGLGDDYIITIPAISENKENAVQVIQWLYKE